MSLFLCVDCGGSKTSAVVCDASGNIKGRALGGPSNFAYLSLEAFIQAVSLTVSNALKTCTEPPSIDPVPLPPPQGAAFARAWFGVSGVDSPAAVARLTPVLSKLLGIPVGPRLVIANDTHLLAAPIRLHSDIDTCVAVIGGTGSICVSFREDEKESKIVELGRTGGWGWLLGDEGGGFHVGREAVRQVLGAFDRASHTPSDAPQSTLTKALLELYKVKDVPEILPLLHMPDPVPGAKSGLELTLGEDTPGYMLMAKEKRLSTLSPLVFKCAFEDGDELALNVLRTCAGALADQVASLLSDPKEKTRSERKPLAGSSAISFGGSVVGIERYRRLLLDALEAKGHVFKYVGFVDDAAAAGCAGLVASAAQNAV